MSRLTPPTAAAPVYPWSGAARLLVSLWLIYHLLAIVAGPINAPPTIHGSALQPWVQTYHRVLFLGHAYKFFAPNPGPSHLIEFVVERADGTRVEGVFPNRNEHWPRLLYHRHFMLTEHAATLLEPNLNDPSLDPSKLTWETIPIGPALRTRASAYGQHLLARFDGQRVTLTLVEHDLTPMEAVVRENAKLTDPRSYARRPLGVFSREAP